MKEMNTMCQVAYGMLAFLVLLVVEAAAASTRISVDGECTSAILQDSAADSLAALKAQWTNAATWRLPFGFGVSNATAPNDDDEGAGDIAATAATTSCLLPPLTALDAVTRAAFSVTVLMGPQGTLERSLMAPYYLVKSRTAKSLQIQENLLTTHQKCALNCFTNGICSVAELQQRLIALSTLLQFEDDSGDQQETKGTSDAQQPEQHQQPEPPKSSSFVNMAAVENDDLLDDEPSQLNFNNGHHDASSLLEDDDDGVDHHAALSATAEELLRSAVGILSNPLDKVMSPETRRTVYEKIALYARLLVPRLDVYFYEKWTITVPTIPVDSAKFTTHGRRLVSREARDLFRVVSFPPLFQLNRSAISASSYNTDNTSFSYNTDNTTQGIYSSPGRFVCPTEVVHRLSNQLRYASLMSTTVPTILQSADNTDATRGGGSTISAGGLSTFVEEECVIKANNKYQSQGPSLIPSWLRLMFGLDMISSEATIREFATSMEGKPLFRLECEIYRRVASDPLCLSFSSPRSKQGTEVQLATDLILDWMFLALLGALIAVSLMRPIVLRYHALQLALCMVLGVAIILCALMYFVFNDLRKSRAGKVGIFTLFAVGGTYMVMEGVLSAIIGFVVAEVQVNAYIQIGIAAAGAVSAAFSEVFLKQFLVTICQVLFTVTQGVLFVLLYSSNPEATVYTAVILIALPIALPLTRALLGVLLCPIRLVVHTVSGLLHLSRRSSEDSLFDLNDPEDDAAVYKKAKWSEASEFVLPLAQGLGGRNIIEKQRLYESSGSSHTRAALSELAATIRRNPQKYAGLVRDPAGLARFAGTDEGND